MAKPIGTSISTDSSIVRGKDRNVVQLLWKKPAADQALLLQNQQMQQELQLAPQEERLPQCKLTWGLGSTAGQAEGSLGWLSSVLMELKHYPQMRICISECLMLLVWRVNNEELQSISPVRAGHTAQSVELFGSCSGQAETGSRGNIVFASGLHCIHGECAHL